MSSASYSGTSGAFDDKFAKEGLTFDDVLIVPAASSVLPREVSTKTRFTRTITLNVPIVSAAMDTVTEARLAIALAREGGIGVIHSNLPIAEQAQEVDRPAAVAHDRHVVRDADDGPPLQPHGIVSALPVPAMLDAAVQGHDDRLLGPLELPGRPGRKPVVGFFLLITVVDFLMEQAVLVVDPVAVAGHP